MVIGGGESFNHVFIGLYREVSEGVPAIIILNLIPMSVSGVRRARVLVDSRHVSTLFTESLCTLTIQQPSELTPLSVHQVLLDSSRRVSPHMPRRNASQIPVPVGRISSPQQMRRSFSENSYEPSRSPPPPPKSVSFVPPERAGMVSEMPPPIPPKEHHRDDSRGTKQPHGRYGQLERHIISDPRGESAKRSKEPVNQFSLLHEKWLAERSVTSDPAERARRRLDAQRQEEEEKEALRMEEKRRAELMRRKKEALLREQEEETIRRTSLEQQLRKISVERRAKEKKEEEEEERRRHELEAKRRAERERRIEEHKKLEEWRLNQLRLAEEASRQAEELQRQEEVERKSRVLQVEKRLKRLSAVGGDLMTGWVTMQASNLLAWKRRYYRLVGTVIHFYRSPKDDQHVLESVELAGKLRNLCEWNQGYEELKAIPHSFAVEFQEDGFYWSMYADSEEDKVKLIALLRHAAGLR
ncbi:hypothetical protein BDN72DRAFT_837346 [Pluteus cervinus]|uniref:Uncharacterized protein n=1 Tax=Pluteus cervinus TaxID=181527 RepID=A0ACD3B176_9AGAR|nr:hypothetical protein BDN72DRAFT_837346 [Pluteus cervinus]